MLEVSFYDVRELYGYGGPALGGALYVSGKRQFEKPGNYAAMHLQTDFPNKDLSQRPSEGDPSRCGAECRQYLSPRSTRYRFASNCRFSSGCSSGMW